MRLAAEQDESLETAILVASTLCAEQDRAVRLKDTTQQLTKAVSGQVLLTYLPVENDLVESIKRQRIPILDAAIPVATDLLARHDLAAAETVKCLDEDVTRQHNSGTSRLILLVSVDDEPLGRFRRQVDHG